MVPPLRLTILMVSRYVIGYGLGPMIFSPMSEIPFFGRNIPYISSFALFVILCVPTALVDNYAGLLVLRFLTGFMGSPCLATGGATMQDLYSLLKLPYALTAWVAGKTLDLDSGERMITWLQLPSVHRRLVLFYLALQSWLRAGDGPCG